VDMRNLLPCLSPGPKWGPSLSEAQEKNGQQMCRLKLRPATAGTWGWFSGCDPRPRHLKRDGTATSEQIEDLGASTSVLRRDSRSCQSKGPLINIERDESLNEGRSFLPLGSGSGPAVA